MQRLRLCNSYLSSGLLAAVVCVCADLRAQTAPPPSHWEPIRVHSGVHANPTPVEGVVWRDFVTTPDGTPWIRLYFTKVWLDKGSYLRMVSLRDGDIMTMRQEHMVEWSFSSAYFNGNAVMVEIVAGPNTLKNFVEIDKVMAADINPPAVPGPDQICGATDDRIPVVDAAVGRLDPIGCTGWIINVPGTVNDKLHLSAGHCASAGQVIEFNVPGSAANCALAHPPASRQFAIDFANSQFVNGGVGNDWWVFRCFRNPTTGLSSFQTQGRAYNLAAAIPALNTNITENGFGLDGTDANNAGGGNAANCFCTPGNGTGTRNQTLQTHNAPLVGNAGTTLNFLIDDCGGNSGSVLYNTNTGLAIGIATHGGCPGVGSNAGTAITNAGLQAGITALSAAAGPVVNDECASALPVVNGTNGTYNSGSGTQSAPAFSCGSGVTRDIWFVYRATCTGNTTFDTCTANRTFDTVMEVWDACGGTMLACNDDMGAACTVGTAPTNFASRVSIATTAGNLYRIRVGGFGGAAGLFDLNIGSCNLRDECVDALPLLAGLNGPYSNMGATTSAPAWPCAGGGSDVWFRYTPACANSGVTFTTCDAASYDTAIEVFTGGCGNLTSIGCNDDTGGPCGLRSTLTVAAPGVTPQPLWIRVGGFVGSTGTFMLRVSETPSNDECATALAVGNGVNGPFCNIGANTSSAWPCGAGGSDVWFTYTAAHTGNLIVTTCTPTRSYDTTLQVFSGGCGGLVSMACNDDACDVLGSSLTVAVTSGTQYWIRVGGFGGAQGVFDLLIGGTAANDHCHQAVPIVLGTNGLFTNVNSTTSPPAWPCGFGACDVWFRYTAACSAPHTFSTCTPARTYDTTLEVFSGGCSGLTSLACNDDTGGACGFGSTVTVGLVNGVTYLIRVGGFSGATGNFELTAATGTNAGTIATACTGCGPMTIAVSGNPNIGGTVNTTITLPSGLPFVGLGFGPFCPPAFCGPCIVGHGWSAVVFGTTHSITIPCDPIYIGAQFGIQGAGFLTPGGCPGPLMSLTSTVVVTIG